MKQSLRVSSPSSSATIINVPLLDTCNVHKVFWIVKTQFLSFRICKNAKPKKKELHVTGTGKFENGKADLNLVGKYFSMLEIWTHYAYKFDIAIDSLQLSTILGVHSHNTSYFPL
jgi:hypothetical protein